MTKPFNRAIFRCKSASKFWLIMKLTTLLIFASCLQLSANTIAQRVTISEKDVSLTKIFEKVRKQTGYQFFYQDELLQKANKIKEINVKDIPLENLLDICFRNQPFTYEIVEKTITVKPIAQIYQTYFQQNEVHGIITDTSGKPMSGVSIIIVGSKKGTFSNEEGEYSLNANISDQLEFSFIGYINQRIAVNGNTLNVRLESTSTALNEVVVVGFGTQKKADITGSVYQVTSKEIENRPVNNLGQALQGLVPNLNITNSNGAPNSMPSFNIRGGTSFFRDPNNSNKPTVENNAPYILIDGVEGDINSLNPDDVESVTTLSDAASAAIYGARAAFGVILVTTKKGKLNQKTTATYSNMFEWDKPTATPDMMSSTEIQQAVVDAYAFTNQSAPTAAVTLLDSVKAYAADPAHHNPYYMNGAQIVWNGNSNDYKMAVSNSAPIQKHNISLSGGSEKTSYYASLSYLDQDGIYKINTDKFKRYNFTFNVSTKVNDWFKTDIKSLYTRQTYSQPVNPGGKGGWWVAMAHEPNNNVFMPIKTPANAPIPNNYTSNILSYMSYGSSDADDNSTMMVTVSPTVTPVKNWNIKGDFSYRAEFDHNKTVIPTLDQVQTSWDPADFATDYTNPSNVSRTLADLYHYTINLYTDYSLDIHNDHHFYGLIGFNQEYESDDNLYAIGNGLISTSVPVISQTSGTPVAPSDGESHWAARGTFYRFTYNYKGKYFLESNGRYDASSKFSPDHRGALFPGISAGWRISQEGFMQGSKNVITDLKFRGSYASLGNQNVNNYLYIPSYGTNLQENQIMNNALAVGVSPPGLVDPNLTWEKATTLDLGFDLTLIDKLSTNFSWYKRRTTDIISDGAAYPAVLGANSPQTNSGILQAKGFDLQLNWRDQTNYGLNYSLTFTLSNYITHVVSFNGNPTGLLSTLYSGEKVGDIWGYTTAGIYQDSAQIANGPNQSRITSKNYPGDIEYKDLDGNDSITQGLNTLANHGDLRIIGNNSPKYAFSFNSFFSWKNFDLNIFLQGIGKRDYYITDNIFWGAISGGSGTEEVYKNSWTPNRPNAKYPAYRAAAANVTTQTRFMFNAAYLRLKNISLGYTLPSNIAKKVAMQKLRVSVSAYNLLTFSGVPKYFDPEVLSANYPILKTIAISLQATF